jgi:vacuolar protein sorting-associated protein 45
VKKPHYKEYYICKTFFNQVFSNIATQEGLEKIAEADKNHIVQGVFEYYADYIALDKYLYSLQIKSITPFYYSNFDSEAERTIIERMINGLSSLVLSHKKRPYIRYQKNSSICKHLAKEFSSLMESEQLLFDYRSENPSILLIIDRRDDPVTPLLTQWTYQSMVHEQFGIELNRVDTKVVEMVLSQNEDMFFKTNMYSNWGDLCSNIKALVDKYASETKNTKSLSTFEDIKKVMDNLPKFKEVEATIEKHMKLVMAIKGEIKERKLLQVSKLEQEIVCNESHSNCIKVKLN